MQVGDVEIISSFEVLLLKSLRTRVRPHHGGPDRPRTEAGRTSTSGLSPRIGGLSRSHASSRGPDLQAAARWCPGPSVRGVRGGLRLCPASSRVGPVLHPLPQPWAALSPRPQLQPPRPKESSGLCLICNRNRPPRQCLSGGSVFMPIFVTGFRMCGRWNSKATPLSQASPLRVRGTHPSRGV